MKKLFTLLFAAALAVSLAMPVFAQDSSASQSSASSAQSAPKAKKQHKDNPTQIPLGSPVASTPHLPTPGPNSASKKKHKEKKSDTTAAPARQQ